MAMCQLFEPTDQYISEHAFIDNEPYFITYYKVYKYHIPRHLTSNMSFFFFCLHIIYHFGVLKLVILLLQTQTVL
jgi:hypothetical protein